MQVGYSHLRERFMWDWRPAGYFRPKPRLQELLSTVKGAQRRALIEHIADEGALDGLPGDLAAESLPEETRVALGRIHPMMMGGEYLPNLVPNETEIARVELESTTADVLSVRARPLGNRIAYRIIDEYSTVFECHPRTSRRPLTLRQLVNMMDGCCDRGGLVLGYIAYNVEDGGVPPRELLHFATVRSAFYPELGDWYRACSEALLEAYEAPRALPTPTTAPSSNDD